MTRSRFDPEQSIDARRAERAGDYRSPQTTWHSDIDRREAAENAIRTTPDGDLSGWASY